MQKAYQARNNVDDGSEEKEKIESLSQCIYEICTATRIKKLVKIAQYSTQFIEEVEMNTLEMNNFNSEAPADTTRHDLSQLVNMTAVDKMKYLCDEYGEEGKFDFTSDKISKRYQPFVSGLKRELDLDLQPLATSKEREMLISISKCKNKDDIDDLLEKFYKDRNMDCMCKYIRLAFANATELWASRQLSNINHNESWFRTNVYSFIWDKIFLSDDKFISKRADCYSNTTKQFNNIDNQRVDFILRNINDNNDYVSAEEKPGRKGVKSDLQKGKILQIAMLQLWNHKIRSTKIMEQMEAITCQWEGLKLTIYATKYISSKRLITYIKGSFTMPKDETHCASFAVLLVAMLSLKRRAFLNYSKLNAILEAKSRYEIEMMNFDPEDENDFVFRSESTEEIEARENDKNNEKEMDGELEEELLNELNDIKLEEDIVTSSDWEDFIMKKISRKRKM